MSNDHSIDVEIGAVFTPMKWGKYACERYGITNAWLNGAQIFDPTMGEGDLLLALIESGLNRGVELDDLPMQNLYGNEVHPRIYQKAQGKLASFGLSSNQISNEDFFKLKPRSFDFIFGNPPWLNYHDLPESYKPFIRDKFKELGLVSSGKIMLLGNSRIDISALVVQLSIILHVLFAKAIFWCWHATTSREVVDGWNRCVKSCRIALHLAWKWGQGAPRQGDFRRFDPSSWEPQSNGLC